MTKYYDRSGIEISSAKIRCVDSVKGTAEYTFRIVCDKCNGRGERKHFIEVAVWLVKPRVTASKRPVLLTR